MSAANRPGGSQPGEGKGKRKGDDKGDSAPLKKGFFTKDLRLMMYGFGDTENPLQETVEVVEDILVDYITDFVHKAMDHAAKTGKVQKEDLLFQVRKDPRKFNRAMELLTMEARIKEARRCIEDIDPMSVAAEAAEAEGGPQDAGPQDTIDGGGEDT